MSATLLRLHTAPIVLSNAFFNFQRGRLTQCYGTAVSGASGNHRVVAVRHRDMPVVRAPRSTRSRLTSTSATVLATVATVAAVAACGAESAPPNKTPTASSTARSSLPPAPDALTITVTGTGSARVMTLTCDPPGGKHPMPDLACRALERWPGSKAGRGPKTSPPCPSQPLGDERATITGTYDGHRLDVTVTRGGCGSADWGALLSVIAPPYALLD